MPTRVIREGILTSKRVNALSEMAELFYRRLQQIVDDHGRYFADETQLRTNCFPARIKRYTDEQVLGWRQECEAVGLLRVYRVDDIDYLEMADFRQQIKSKSKYPGPAEGTPVDPCPTPPTPTEDPCTVRTRAVHDPYTLVVGEGVVEDEGGGAARAGAEGAPPPLPDPDADEPDDPGRVVPIRAADRFDVGEPTAEGVIAAWLVEQERKAGRQVRGISSLDPKLRAWVKAEVTHAEIAEAYRLACEARAASGDRTPINVGFIDVKLRDLRDKAARGAAPVTGASRPARAAWERDTQSMLAEARRIGLEVDGSWTADDLAWRIKQRHRAQGVAA